MAKTTGNGVSLGVKVTDGVSVATIGVGVKVGVSVAGTVDVQVGVQSVAVSV